MEWWQPLSHALTLSPPRARRYESDDNAVCIDTGIKPCKCKWNMNGTILAVAGYQLGGGGERECVWMDRRDQRGGYKE